MRFDEVPIPEGAEERAWQVVLAAFEQRTPAPRERHLLRPALALAVVAAAAGVLASPPGRAVLDSLREAVGVERAQPELFSLPARGRVLVVSQRGPWIVQADGSKRFLGRYREASWSPFGRFVVSAQANELVALDPKGDVRWTLSRPGVRFPRWGGSRTDTRIVYLSGTRLRVVAGDATADHLLARRALPVAPAWRPGPAHVLAYVRSDGFLRVVDADRRTVLLRTRTVGAPIALDWVADRLLVVSRSALRLYDDSGSVVLRRRGSFAAAALAPRAQALAVVREEGSVSAVDVFSRQGRVRRLFAGTGRFDRLAWSPDGRWLVISWPDANQWVFVRVSGPRKIAAVSNIAQQFGGSFPRLAGWCCAS